MENNNKSLMKQIQNLIEVKHKKTDSNQLAPNSNEAGQNRNWSNYKEDRTRMTMDKIRDFVTSIQSLDTQKTEDKIKIQEEQICVHSIFDRAIMRPNVSRILMKSRQMEIKDIMYLEHQ